MGKSCAAIAHIAAMPKSSAFALLIVCACGVIFAAGANEECGRGKKYQQGDGRLLLKRTCCSAWKCWSLCKNHPDCKGFDYFPKKGGCRLFSDLKVKDAGSDKSLYCLKAGPYRDHMSKAELKPPAHASCTAAARASCNLPTLRI